MAATGRRTQKLSEDGEADLSQLEKQMRLDAEKKEDLTAVLRTQAASIDKLSKDNRQLKEELEVVQRDVAATQQASSELRILQAKIEYYQSEIDSEKERLGELEKTSAEMEGKVKEARKKVGGRTGVVAQPVADGQQRTLENRLETALREYNNELTRNAAQRQTIDHLRQERKLFDGLLRKLGGEIQELKKSTAELMEKAAQAHDGREEALNKAAALKERADKELAQYNIDIKELTRVLEHDRKLRSFMAVKGQERKDAGLTQTLSKTKKQEEKVKEEDGPPEERLAKLQNVFNQIMEKTGVTTLEQAVDRFIQGEAANFSAFQYVTELNNNIEQLQEKIAELDGKAEKTLQDFATAQAARERRIAKIKEEVESSEKILQAVEASSEASKQQLESLATPVEDLFGQIGCERAALGDTLGNDHVSRSNLKLFLSVIEQRTNQLMQLRARLDARAKQKWETQEAELRDQALGSGEVFDPTSTLGPKPTLPSLLGPGPKVLSPPAAPHVPSTEAGSDLDEIDDDQPLSLEDLKARLKNAGGAGELTRQKTLEASINKSMRKNASSFRMTKKR